jgi:hypothetical protein
MIAAQKLALRPISAKDFQGKYLMPRKMRPAK